MIVLITTVKTDPTRSFDYKVENGSQSAVII